MSIKVTISGAHSQGKTTLLDRLSRDSYLAQQNFRFGASSVRELQKIGVNISEAGNDVTQALVISTHIQNAYKEGNWVLDRCILDSAAYGFVAKSGGKIKQATMDFNWIIAKELISKYDLMFYIMPELPLVNDGTRSLDQQYFEDACRAFEHAITTLELPIIRLRGTVEQRYNTVLDHVKNLTQ
jgi:nicotinamide riboside kinase